MTTASELDEAALAEIEALGRIARDAMIALAKAQESPQAARMAPWEEMLDGGRALYRAAARAVAEHIRAAAERDAREWQRSNGLAMDDLRACTAELRDARQEATTAREDAGWAIAWIGKLAVAAGMHDDEGQTTSPEGFAIWLRAQHDGYVETLADLRAARQRIAALEDALRQIAIAPCMYELLGEPETCQHSCPGCRARKALGINADAEREAFKRSQAVSAKTTRCVMEQIHPATPAAREGDR